MFVETAAMLVRFATMLALQVSRSSLLLLCQTRAIARSPHPLFRLVDSLKRRQRRTVDHRAAGTRFGSGYVLWQAARNRRVAAVIQRCQSRFRHGATSVDS